LTMHRRENMTPRITHKILVRKSEGKIHLEDARVHGKTTLKLGKEVRKLWTEYVTQEILVGFVNTVMILRVP